MQAGKAAASQAPVKLQATPTQTPVKLTEHDERGRVAGHVNGLAVGVEAAEAGAHHDGADEARQATHHVHNGAAWGWERACVFV